MEKLRGRKPQLGVLITFSVPDWRIYSLSETSVAAGVVI